MASKPECISDASLSPDVAASSARSMSDADLIQAIIHPDPCGPVDREVLEREHAFRFVRPNYAVAFEIARTQAAEPELLAEPRYQIFDIDQFHSLPLPSGGTFSKWIDRMQGEQCLQVIDVNQNGMPDDGDTCIGRNGGLYPDAKFVGQPLFSSTAGMACSNLAQWRRYGDCKRTYDAGLERSMASLRDDAAGVTFDVHAPGGPERYCMRQAGAMQGVGESVVGSVEEHPYAAFAVTVGAGLLLANAYTRGPTLAVLKWLGIGGAAVGAGGVVYDGVMAARQYAQDGNIEKFEENMSRRHIMWFLFMMGAPSGMTVSQAMTSFFITGPDRVAAILAAGGRQLLAASDRLGALIFPGVGGGGFGGELVLEGVGAGGGGIALPLEAEGVGALGGSVVAPGVLAGGPALGPIGPLTVARTAQVQTPGGNYEVNIPDRFTPKAQWNGETADLAKQIEGWIRDAEAADPALEGALAEVQSQLKAIRDIYERVPNAEIRQTITKELSDVYAALEDAVSSDAPLGEIGGLLREGVRKKLDLILLEANVRVPNFATWEKVKPSKFALPPEGAGIEIHPAAVKEIGRNQQFAARMKRVYEIIDAYRKAGGDPKRIAADVQPWAGNPALKKITFQEGAGLRFFFSWNGNGKTALLKAITKPAPAAEATAAATAWERAREMGFASLFVLTIREGMAEISEVPPEN